MKIKLISKFTRSILFFLRKIHYIYLYYPFTMYKFIDLVGPLNINDNDNDNFYNMSIIKSNNMTYQIKDVIK